MLPFLTLTFVLFTPSRALGCVANGGTCVHNADCCSGDCDGTSCATLQANGGNCSDDLDCKSQACYAPIPPPPCAQATCCNAGKGTDTCNVDADCCPGFYCLLASWGFGLSTNVCSAKVPVNSGCLDRTTNCAGGPCRHPNVCITGVCNLANVCTAPVLGANCSHGNDCLNLGAGATCDANQCGNSPIGWCCFTTGSGACTAANAATTCCSQSCNLGTHHCN
jgi:hypothetical protein